MCKSWCHVLLYLCKLTSLIHNHKDQAISLDHEMLLVWMEYSQRIRGSFVNSYINLAEDKRMNAFLSKYSSMKTCVVPQIKSQDEIKFNYVNYISEYGIAVFYLTESEDEQTHLKSPN